MALLEILCGEYIMPAAKFELMTTSMCKTKVDSSIEFEGFC